MNDQRTELSGLAKKTISKSETIIRKLKETVEGKRRLNSGMRSIFRDMRGLLSFSEWKLSEAKEIITNLRKKISKVSAALTVFKGLVEAVKERDAAIKRGGISPDEQSIIIGVLNDIRSGYNSYHNAKRGDGYMSFVNSVMTGLTHFTTGLIKASNRLDVGPMLKQALNKIGKAEDIVKIQKTAIEEEVVLITQWNEAVFTVKTEVFSGNLEGGSQEDRDLFDEIEEMIAVGDVYDIYAAFYELKGAASSYLSQVKRVCRSCTD